MPLRLSYFFLFALLCHLLLFVGLTSSFTFWVHPAQDPPESDEQKGNYVPSYVYHEPPKPMSASAPVAPSTPVTKSVSGQQAVSKQGLLPTTVKTPRETKTSKASRSQSASIPNLISMKKIDKPLLKLLSKATIAQLRYPKSASDFLVKGRVLVEFMLFPSGLVSDVTLVQTSGSGVLDQAALDTINAISPVEGVDQYLQAPESIEVGIIFS